MLSSDFIVKFEQISLIALVFPLLNLNKLKLAAHLPIS